MIAGVVSDMLPYWGRGGFYGIAYLNLRNFLFPTGGLSASRVLPRVTRLGTSGFMEVVF